jgi:putative transposase
MVYLCARSIIGGEILESFVTKIGTISALAFMKKALQRHGSPRQSSPMGCAFAVRRWQLRKEGGENGHLPFRRRERAMFRFRQMKSLQKFAAVHSSLRNHFNEVRNIPSLGTCAAPAGRCRRMR